MPNTPAEFRIGTFHLALDKNKETINFCFPSGQLNWVGNNIKVTEQVRGCIAVILQKCLNLYIILKVTEPRMTWKYVFNW